MLTGPLNRAAALKCRQRKKQWLANLQQKVETYSTENDHLLSQISQLREEVVNLKTLLLAHRTAQSPSSKGYTVPSCSKLWNRSTLR